MILSFLLLRKPINVLHCEPHLLGMWNVLAGHGANVIVEWLGVRKLLVLHIVHNYTDLPRNVFRIFSPTS